MKVTHVLPVAAVDLVVSAGLALVAVVEVVRRESKNAG